MSKPGMDEVCVVGAGAAGLATALRLADNGVEVTLIDGGGPNIAATGSSLHGGSIASSVATDDTTDDTLVGGTLYPHDHLITTRWRQPGGAAWRWAARGRPGADRTVRMVEAHPTDFDERPEFDIPGFPFPADEVLSYRDLAFDFIDLAGHTFDPADYDDGSTGIEMPTEFYDKIFHFPKAEVIQKTRPNEASAHPLIDFRTGLHLLRMERSGSRISALQFVDESGELHRLTPRTVVLCLGGVENSRQLLVSASEGVVPDPHDLIGRYFVDHPHIRLGYLPGADVEEMSYYDFQEVRDTFVLRGHGIDPKYARTEHLLRFSIDIVGRHSLDGTATGLSLAQLRDGVQRRDLSLVARSAVRALRHPIDAARLGRISGNGWVHHTGAGGWSDHDERMHPIGIASVESMFEQRPSADNRVRLGNEVDRFGVPLPVLQWSFSDVEVAAIRRAVDVTSSAFEQAGLGPLTTMAELGDDEIPRAGTGLHHMGGTRMHSDPEAGVVDEHGRLHQLDNLYLGGSSVFPSSVGYANPTFTILQMALRLGDHLARNVVSRGRTIV